MMTPAPIHHQHDFAYSLVAVGWWGAASVMLGELASAENVPLLYIAAVFVGLGVIVSVIKVWVWVEDRQKKEILASELRMHEAIKDAFKAHNDVEDEWRKRIEQKIDVVIERRRAPRLTDVRRGE